MLSNIQPSDSNTSFAFKTNDRVMKNIVKTCCSQKVMRLVPWQEKRHKFGKTAKKTGEMICNNCCEVRKNKTDKTDETHFKSFIWA